MKNKHIAPRSPFIRALEPRVLYDGAMAATAADTATDQAFAGHHDGHAPDAHAEYHVVTVIGHDSGGNISLGTSVLSERSLQAFANSGANAGHEGGVRVFDQSILDAASQRMLVDGSWMDSSDAKPLFVLEARNDHASGRADNDIASGKIAASVNDYSAAGDTPGIIFVDKGIGSYENLVDQLDSNAEIVLIDSDTDGVEQI